MSIEFLFDAAFREHQAGNLGQAQAIYQQVLEKQPLHADALHLMGVLAYQLGRLDIAEQLIGSAIEQKPTATYFGNLGLVQAAAGRIGAAIAAYRRAVELRDDFAEAHNNLGNILRQTGQHQEAIAAYHRAIECRPDFSEALNNLGLSLCDAGRFDEAITTLGRAIALNPNSPDLRNNLGNAFKQIGRLDEAVAALGVALKLDPNFPEAHNNLGVIFFSRGRAADAIEEYTLALAARPDFADAHFNLAIALHERGDIPQAIAACRRAIIHRPGWAEAYNNVGIWLGQSACQNEAIAAFDAAIAARPAYPEAHNNRANALRQIGNLNDAIHSYKCAITLNPSNSQAWNNLGTVLGQLGRLEEAIAALGQALALQPDLAEAHNNLGNVLKDRGELDAALACYARAAALQPGNAAADSNRIYTLYFHPGYSAEMILAEHRRWNHYHAAPLRSRIEPHENNGSPGRRLRIGYVAPDFRDHCQSLFTVPLFSHHDHRRFEIYCYSDVASPDAVTERLRSCADAWRNIAGQSDERVAAMIRTDRIDVLVDLTVHMSHNRLAVFAQKPAPIQATWLGYPGTTGLETMDYRLSDPYLDPPGNDPLYAEQTVRLPDSFWCYDPLTREPEVNRLPALSNGFITFGCLNNFCKINDQTLAVWAQVLRATPNSRLLLLTPEGNARRRVLEVLGGERIDPSRVDFTARLPRRKYLELYHRIDVGLDSFPYNGHTTSLDSAWMGVPVVTRHGRTAVSRAGLSQLYNLGLSELATESAGAFIRVAAELAADIVRVAELRSTLRDRMERSPLMDARRFARNLEAAFSTMYENRATLREIPPRRTDRITFFVTDAVRHRRRRVRQAS